MQRYLVSFLLVLVLALGAGVFVRAALQRPDSQQSPEELQSPPPTPVGSGAAISGLVLPHHDLVKAQRQALLQAVRAKGAKADTVILVSPNHYESGQGVVQTSQQVWSLTDRTVQPNDQVIRALLESKKASLEPDSFANEHGIKLVLSDIFSVFPKAEIVPLIIKQSATQEDMTALTQVLMKDCNGCLFIASVDFSHYQPALLASLHDDLTLRGLVSQDLGILGKAETDSPGALILLAQWAKMHNTDHFVAQNHTNSGELTKDTDIETTTHIFGWYEAGAPVPAEKSVTFLIGGDMMFGRSIAHTFLKTGLWHSVDQLGERLFWGTDAAIVNLEGPVSDVSVPDDTRSNNLVFNFPPETIGALKYMHVNAASQANNHSANAGVKGLETTRRLLKEAAIQSFGGPGDNGINEVATFTGEGITLKVIGVHTLASQPDLAPLIQKLKEDSTAKVLIFPHWGAEYQPQHGASQEKLAHAWIDAGADIVIGAHPHVIQDSELYKGKPIFYSLGNLLFDQDFSKETQQGLLIAGKWTEKGLSVFALPVQDKKYKPSLMKGDAKAQLLRGLYEPFEANKQDTPGGAVLFFPSA